MHVARAKTDDEDPYKGDQEMYPWTERLVELAKPLNNKCSLLWYNSADDWNLLTQIWLDQVDFADKFPRMHLMP